MDITMKTVIDKYDIGQNGMFTAEDVRGIVKDIKKTEYSSSTNRKVFLSSCVLLAIATVMDRAFLRSSNDITFLSTPNAEDDSVRRLQEAGYFDDWVTCDGVSTVPASYVDGGTDSSIMYLCDPNPTTFGCGDTTPPPSTQPSTHPSESPSLSPSTHPTSPPSRVTSSPSENPTSSPTSSPSAAADTCFNTLAQWSDESGVARDCEYIDQNPDLQESLCVGDVVIDACPVACKTCCGDNPDYVFETTNLGTQNCAWIEDSLFRKLVYCRDDNFPGVRVACAETCGACPSVL